MNLTSKHVYLMLACCLVTVAVLAAISAFQVPVSTVLLFGLVLLCPLAHLLMMKFMIDDHSADRAVRKVKRETQPYEEKKESAF